MKKEWPGEKREKGGTEEGGSPKKEKKRKRKTEKPRPLSLCVVCYSDTFPRSFIHTHIRSTTHTHTYIYIPTLFIYTNTEKYSKHGRQKVARGGDGRVGKRCGPSGGGSPRNHSFQSYHSSRPQTGSPYHAVTSSLYHRRRVYDDQTIGFRWQITDPLRERGFSDLIYYSTQYGRVQLISSFSIMVLAYGNNAMHYVKSDWFHREL